MMRNCKGQVASKLPLADVLSLDIADILENPGRTAAALERLLETTKHTNSQSNVPRVDSYLQTTIRCLPAVIPRGMILLTCSGCSGLKRQSAGRD